MKPKEYLLKHGHITSIGRGRLSREHIAIIEQAVSEGVSIEGYSVSKPTAAVADKPTVERVQRDPNTIPDVPDETRPESSWQAYANDREVGMRTVCNVCGSSLSYCPCSEPKVWVDYDRQAVVYFKPRKIPLTNRKW